MADGGDQGRAVDLHAVAAALRRDYSVVRKRSAKENWPFAEIAVRGGRKRLYPLTKLPSDVQAAFALAERPELSAVEAAARAHRREQRNWSDEQIQSAWARYARSRDTIKLIGIDRALALDAVARVIEQGASRMDAEAAVAKRLACSTRSLHRWRKTVGLAARPYWPALLLPQWCGGSATEITPEAWDFFKADYLRFGAPAANAVYDRLTRVARERGWTLPCMRTLLRRVRSEVPRAVVILARQGEEALARTYPAQQRDRSVFGALEAVNADGHRFDVFVRWPDGHVQRPMMVAWQDLYSGKLLAYRIGETESSDQVRLAFGDLVTNYGIPSHAWLDNGRGFAAKMLTGGSTTRYRFKVRAEDPIGLFVQLGTSVHWTTPYHGQAKPIERCFRDLCEYVAKHPAFAGAYTGNSPMAKPEDYGSRAVPLEQFLQVLADEIAAHNARVGRRSKVCAGRSFDQVFADSYARTPVRKASTEQCRLWLLAADSVSADARTGEVKLSGNRYWCEALSAHAGRRVIVRFDPDALHGSVHVYALEGTYIGEAECIASVGFADTQAGRDHARARRQYINAQKASLQAERRMSAAQVADQMPKGKPIDLPDAKVIKPVFGRRPSSSSPATGELTEAEKAFGNLMDQQLQRLKSEQL